VQGDGVGHRLPQVVAADRVKLVRRRTDEREDDGDIVRSQAPEHVLLTADRPQIHPVGLEAQEATDRAGCDEVPERRNGRVILEDMADHEPSVEAPCQGGQLLGLPEIERERLLDEDMLAGQQGARGEVVMGRRLGGDRDRLDRRLGQNLLEGQGSAAVSGRDRLDRLGMVVGDGSEAAQFGKAADQVLPPGAAADHRNLNARRRAGRVVGVQDRSASPEIGPKGS
jgi:hypothetical protein